MHAKYTINFRFKREFNIYNFMAFGRMFIDSTFCFSGTINKITNMKKAFVCNEPETKEGLAKRAGY